MTINNYQQNNFPDITKPFFAYGIFRPGEISFLGIEDCIASIEKFSLNGDLYWWDGINLFKPSLKSKEIVQGYKIKFKSEKSTQAYDFIEAIEPSLYYWKIIRDQNVLAGVISYDKLEGSYEVEFKSVWEDPYFNLEERDSVINHLKKYETEDGHDFLSVFELQMRYLALWSVVERFITLRYGNIKGRQKLAANKYFSEKLLEVTNKERRVIYSTQENKYYFLNATDDDQEKAGKLSDNWKLEQNIAYYYQVRCNITHRGKALYHDFNIIKKSFNELLQIMEYVLIETKKECEKIKQKYER